MDKKSTDYTASYTESMGSKYFEKNAQSHLCRKISKSVKRPKNLRDTRHCVAIVIFADVRKNWRGNRRRPDTVMALSKSGEWIFLKRERRHTLIFENHRKIHPWRATPLAPLLKIFEYNLNLKKIYARYMLTMCTLVIFKSWTWYFLNTNLNMAIRNINNCIAYYNSTVFVYLPYRSRAVRMHVCQVKDSICG